jgi:hypothetical protein
MRLGTLAKELDQKYADLESALITEFSIKNEKGPNFKLEEAHITFLQEKFPTPIIVEPEPIAEVTLEKEVIITESATEEEVEVEIYEIEKEEEETKVAVPEKIELPEIKKVKKPKTATFHNIIPEEPIDYKAKDEEEEEAIKELEARIDTEGVIRAPKVEPLQGIKVLDKIEIPKPLTPEEKEAKRLAKLLEEGKVEVDENGESINYYQAKGKTKEEKEAERKKRKEKKLQNELKAIERKKKSQEKAKKKQKQAKAEKEKEARKQHYIAQMEKQNEKASKTHVSSNTTKPAGKKKAKIKPVEYKPSTGLFGWFWRLLDPK